MLHDFLTANRDLIVERCRLGAAPAHPQRAGNDAPYTAIKVFLGQLMGILELEQSAVSLGEAAARLAVDALAARMVESAALHGQRLHGLGFTVQGLVRHYGHLCQTVTSLALEHDVPLATAEFRTLNRCLHDAIASSVAAYCAELSPPAEDWRARKDQYDRRLDAFAAMHSHVQSATVSLAAIRVGRAEQCGAMNALLDRSLVGLQRLVDDALMKM